MKLLFYGNHSCAINYIIKFPLLPDCVKYIYDCYVFRSIRFLGAICLIMHASIQFGFLLWEEPIIVWCFFCFHCVLTLIVLFLNIAYSIRIAFTDLYITISRPTVLLILFCKIAFLIVMEFVGVLGFISLNFIFDIFSGIKEIIDSGYLR